MPALVERGGVPFSIGKEVMTEEGIRKDFKILVEAARVTATVTSSVIVTCTSVWTRVEFEELRKMFNCIHEQLVNEQKEHEEQVKNVMKDEERMLEKEFQSNNIDFIRIRAFQPPFLVMRCRVSGCDLQHAFPGHYCDFCLACPADHLRWDCPRRCRVPRCYARHWREDHKCDICGAGPDSHSTQDCPNHCRVPGCTALHQKAQHKCVICKEHPTDHIEEDCPLRCQEHRCGGLHMADQHAHYHP